MPRSPRAFLDLAFVRSLGQRHPPQRPHGQEMPGVIKPAQAGGSADLDPLGRRTCRDEVTAAPTQTPPAKPSLADGFFAS